jgi:beta-N-acetylhexosaminidase
MPLRLLYGSVLILVILAGLTLRHPGLGLPWPLAKYGGSVLWGAMIFFIIAVLAPQADLSRRVGAAALVVVLVECIRLYHAPWLDTFRATTAGALLLGRYFSLWDIAAYWMGIALSTFGDRATRPRSTCAITVQ